ncbi:MAG: protein kinase [Actinomycetota bacterium]|nr:protein kinase [Actinomycetota bacterium]
MTRRVADRYVLAEQIGSGGSARVYAAVDERLDRRVAVKLLDAGPSDSADPTNRARFLREGPTSAAFMHRHAVAVFDAGEDDGQLYIVMELVDGPSLAQHLATHGPLAVTDAIRIAGQVLAALAPAHAGGIVHRDVKPGNILLTPGGDAKLTDFGIAKRFDELGSETRAGTTIGTPRYLAPEQATGATLSPATDVYAVGILLFEMLTGRTPFVGDSPVAVAVAQQAHAAPDVRDLRPDVPATIAAIVSRALSKDPADRYASVVEMSTALTSSWSPPPGPLPEFAIPTQVVVTSTPPTPARSGDTEVMSTAGVVAREVEPSAPPERRVPVAMIAAVLVLAVAVFAAVRSRDGDPSGIDAATTATSQAPTVVATTLPPTDAPTTTAGPPVQELIPGFPQTDDLQTFLRQLENDPALVGRAGAALTESLGRLLAENSTKQQRDQAKALTDQLGEWAATGEVHPAIAQSLVDLLAPLAEKSKP